MANTSFTRDEVILTLDTLYSAGEESLTKNNPRINALCRLLQELPIHPAEKRPPNFRNTVGVSDQIRSFREQAYGEGRPRWGVGKIFFEVDKEYENRHDELHAVAEAIRRNRAYFQSCTFGQSEESAGFPEGALLSHLHRTVELRYSAKLERDSRCSICRLCLEGAYQGCEDFLELHLLVPGVDLDAGHEYGRKDFITVCPNCHAALHRYRPWLNRENATEILR